MIYYKMLADIEQQFLKKFENSLKYVNNQALVYASDHLLEKSSE